MAPSDQSRHSLVPGFLYSSKIQSHLSNNTNHGLPLLPSSSSIASYSSSSSLPVQGGAKSPVILSPQEKIRLFSPAYYAACSAGGVFSCGLTHMAVTPLDLVKCNMQVIFFPFQDLSFIQLFSPSYHSNGISKDVITRMKTKILVQVIRSLYFLKQRQEKFLRK